MKLVAWINVIVVHLAISAKPGTLLLGIFVVPSSIKRWILARGSKGPISWRRCGRMGGNQGRVFNWHRSHNKAIPFIPK